MKISSVTQFKKGDPITIAGFHGMSFCHRAFFVALIQDANGATWVEYKENPRGRKTKKARLSEKNLVFAGHMYSPFVDSDESQMLVDCLFNMVGDRESIKGLIARANLNPNFASFGKTYCKAAGQDWRERKPLFDGPAPLDMAGLRALLAQEEFNATT